MAKRTLSTDIEEAIELCDKYDFKERQYGLEIIKGLFEYNSSMVEESFEKFRAIVSIQESEVFAKEISKFQKSNHYTQKVYSMQRKKRR